MIIDSGKIRVGLFGILFLSFLFILISQIVVWGTLDVDTKIGPADASLEAEFYEHSVNYEITGNMSSSGGLIGGLGGGLVGDAKIDIKEYKTFLTGLSEFQENIGLILDSYKDKSYTISTSIWNNQTEGYEKTRVYVKTHVDLIPWWPQGIGQKCSVTVQLYEPGNCQYIKIDNIKIIIWKNIDEVNQVYLESSNPIKEISPDQRLSQRNQSKTYDFDVSISKDYGRVGIIGLVKITIVDKQNNEVPENTIINLGESNPLPTARTNNIYTMDQGEASSIVLMVAAFPLNIVSIILMIIAFPLIDCCIRKASWVILAAMIFSILAFAFYLNGINTLVNLLDSVLVTPVRENFKWTPFFALPVISVVLSIIAFIFSWKLRAEDIKKSKTIEAKKTRRGKAKEALPTFKVIEKPEVEEPKQGEREGETEAKRKSPTKKKRGKRSKKREK